MKKRAAFSEGETGCILWYNHTEEIVYDAGEHTCNRRDIAMKNQVLEKIRNGGKAMGMFHEMGCTAAAEALAIAGLDYFIIDCEHGPFDVESAQAAILAAELHGCTPFARAKEASRTAVLKLLDVGAKGVIVPFIHGLEDAKALVGYAKYAPVGNRGYAHARASKFGWAEYAQDMQTQCETANRETLLIPQCETLGCLEQIEEIAALPGVDGIFVGPLDLSIAMGIPGQLEKPAFKEAVARVLQACKANGKLSFIFAGSAGKGREYLEAGFDSVAVGMDTMLLIQSVRDLMLTMNISKGTI